MRSTVQGGKKKELRASGLLSEAFRDTMVMGKVPVHHTLTWSHGKHNSNTSYLQGSITDTPVPLCFRCESMLIEPRRQQLY